ncbi:hypothetical protein EH205_03810 [Enterococcus faecium]|nr:bifunctional dimerization/transpeptidase penicillin-binding 2B [Enterococcus faecium]
MSQSFFRINGVLIPTPRSQVTIFNKHEKLFFEIATCDSELNGRLTTSWYKRCSKASFSVLSQIYAKMWKAIFTKFFLILETKRLFHNLFFKRCSKACICANESNQVKNEELFWLSLLLDAGQFFHNLF